MARRWQILVSIAIALSATPSGAAIFLAHSTLDTRDASPGDGVCADAEGQCTLPAAADEAAALPGADEILIPEGTYSYGRNVCVDLTLTGAGASRTTLQPLALFVHRCRIRRLTIEGAEGGAAPGILGLGGDLELDSVIVTGNPGAGMAGGVVVQSRGALRIRSSAIHANGGFGITVAPERFCHSGLCKCSPARLDLFNSTVSGNVAGGVQVSGCPGHEEAASISNSTVEGGAGDALSVLEATVSLRSSIVAARAGKAACALAGSTSAVISPGPQRRERRKLRARPGERSERRRSPPRAVARQRRPDAHPRAPAREPCPRRGLRGRLHLGPRRRSGHPRDVARDRSARRAPPAARTLRRRRVRARPLRARRRGGAPTSAPRSAPAARS